MPPAPPALTATRRHASLPCTFTYTHIYPRDHAQRYPLVDAWGGQLRGVPEQRIVWSLRRCWGWGWEQGRSVGFTGRLLPTLSQACLVPIHTGARSVPGPAAADRVRAVVPRLTGMPLSGGTVRALAWTGPCPWRPLRHVTPLSEVLASPAVAQEQRNPSTKGSRQDTIPAGRFSTLFLPGR